MKANEFKQKLTNNKQFHRIESNHFLLCRIAQHYFLLIIVTVWNLNVQIL